MRVAAVVLAAGKSERMGRNKLLLKVRGKPLIELVLDALDTSKVDEIILVLGNKPWEIANAVRPQLNRIKLVVNESYEEGMTSSFKAGLKQIKHAEAAFLVLGDQLILEPKFLNVMIEAMQRPGGKALIVSPIYKGKKGHPLLFSKNLFNEILNLKESEVIRDVVHRHINQLLTINQPKWTIMDIDTPEDFADAVRVFEETLQRSQRA